MIYPEPARTTTGRIPRLLGACLLVGAAALAAALGYPLPMSWPSPAASPVDTPGGEQPRPQQPPRRAPAGAVSPTAVPGGEQPRPQQPPRQAPGEAASPGEIPRAERPGALGEADGVVPDGTTVFDQIPAVAKLDPALLGALRQAAAAAADDGVELYVTSGWRSPAYQSQLLREAVSRYGSHEQAARWVATADTSAHVSGEAIDIGHYDATAWLSEHGADYGLCRIYRNEPWHYELRPEAVDHGCPPMYADPTRDPRMRQ